MFTVGDANDALNELNDTTTDTMTDLMTTPQAVSTTHEIYDYGPIEYDEYMYSGYPFERPLYLYVWEIMVIFVTIVNILVILVLTRRGMRSPTNLILTCIAISDSLTGIITLPSYIIVYSNFVAAEESHYYNHSHMINGSIDQNMHLFSYDNPPNNMDSVPLDPVYNLPSYYTYSETIPMGYNYSFYPSFGASYGEPDQEGYVLTKEECTFFMISKFFLSKFFHTISIFLTLFLGFQRYVSVAYPFRAQSLFTMTKTIIACIIIAVLSPLLHIYHLIKEKAVQGMCEWRIDSCETDCAYLWFILFIRHLIPCICLVAFTILFIRELRKGRAQSGQEQIRRREEENRRVSIIVVAIVIVFLVPEIPYGIFLMVSVIRKHSELVFDLEANRAIHAVYEVSMVMSFHANFYILILVNRRFRSGLKKTLLYPIKTMLGKPARWSVSRSFSSVSNRRTVEGDLSSKSATEMKVLTTTASSNSH